METLRGGKFGNGFISAGVSAALPGRILDNRELTVAFKAIAGGTISRMTGGKFANGAAYGAFAAIAGLAAEGLGFEGNGKPFGKKDVLKEDTVVGGKIKFLLEKGTPKVLAEAIEANSDLYDAEFSELAADLAGKPIRVAVEYSGNSRSMVTTGKTSMQVNISRGATFNVGAWGSIVGHELVHADHYMKLGTIADEGTRNFSELRAYEWQYKNNRKFGSNISDDYLKGKVEHYKELYGQ